MSYLFLFNTTDVWKKWLGFAVFHHKILLVWWLIYKLSARIATCLCPISHCQCTSTLQTWSAHPYGYTFTTCSYVQWIWCVLQGDCPLMMQPSFNQINNWNWKTCKGCRTNCNDIMVSHNCAHFWRTNCVVLSGRMLTMCIDLRDINDEC